MSETKVIELDVIVHPSLEDGTKVCSIYRDDPYTFYYKELSDPLQTLNVSVTKSGKIEAVINDFNYIETQTHEISSPFIWFASYSYRGPW